MAHTFNTLTVIHYDHTDVGRIYLGNVGQRHQLGGGKGLYTLGQDRYISKGQDATFVTTGDLMMDILSPKGRIKHFVDTTSFTWDTTAVS